MNHTHRAAVLGGLLAIALPFCAAQAQLSGDLLKSGANGASSLLGGGAGGLLSGSGAGSSNISNIAGVLQYCLKNKYLSGNSAQSIQDSLMNKTTNKPSTTSSSYTDGIKGILHSDDGKQMNLGGSGLKAAATEQICNTVLSSAKSML